MFRRFVLITTTVAALFAVLLVVRPAGADGGHVTPVESVPDRYSFGRDVTIDAPVGGGVQVLFGDVTVNEVIAGDLVVIGGVVIFAGRGHIHGNLVHAGRVVGSERRVGGRLYSLTTLEGAAASLTRTAVVVALLLCWLLVAIVVTLVGGREVRFSSVEVRASALYCFALGLVAFTSFIITAIMFSYLVPYVIGIPLLVGLGVFGILTKVYGMIAVFHAVGTLVAGSKSRDQLASRKWFRGDLAMIVVGVLLLGALRLIPVVGPVVWSMASLFGIGVALGTKFGRREPWFLVWRTQEA